MLVILYKVLGASTVSHGMPPSLWIRQGERQNMPSMRKHGLEEREREREIRLPPDGR
jgi:hypothetical protein